MKRLPGRAVRESSQIPVISTSGMPVRLRPELNCWRRLWRSMGLPFPGRPRGSTPAAAGILANRGRRVTHARRGFNQVARSAFYEYRFEGFCDFEIQCGYLVITLLGLAGFPE